MTYIPVKKYDPVDIQDGFGELVKPVAPNTVRVIKSLKRSYGYSLQWIGQNPPSWILGPQNTWAWYRYKRDALKAAERYNHVNI